LNQNFGQKQNLKSCQNQNRYFGSSLNFSRHRNRTEFRSIASSYVSLARLLESTESAPVQVCHLAFFETVCQNKMLWPFCHFLAFLNVDKNSIFYGLFWKIMNKFWAFYDSLNFNLVILTIFFREIWPLFGLFSFLRIWPFLKLLMAKFGLFNFFGPGNPAHHCLNYQWQSISSKGETESTSEN